MLNKKSKFRRDYFFSLEVQDNRNKIRDLSKRDDDLQVENSFSLCYSGDKENYFWPTEYCIISIKMGTALCCLGWATHH